MKLFDATLDLAQFSKGTEQYTITAIDSGNNRIECNDLAGRVAEFGGGTIWFMTGDSAGQFGRIESSAGQTIDLLDAFTDGYQVGDIVTIGSWLEYDSQKLINAVNSVLRMYKIIDVNTDLEYDPDTDIYDLPEGVTEDIRKVQLERNNYGLGNKGSESHYWKVKHPRKLYLYDRHKLQYKTGSNIELTFVRMHGAVDKDAEISDQVDPLYLRYMAWLYLCRNLIQNTHKDNLVSSDMYNEAKVYERDYGNLPNKALCIKTWTFPQW